jgi:flagellin-like hook-associated protein FlgL
MEQEMSDITLTASSRNALLSLTDTSSLMSRTQGRLTTGLKVSSAVDNAVAYFQAKGLNDRASDFSTRKDQISQGISGLNAALNGTTLVDSVLKQMEGIVDSVRTADASTRSALGKQFNDLAKQINSGVSDSSYQGLNLINNCTANLTVYFNQGTTATLKVNAQNLNQSVLITGMGQCAGAVMQSNATAFINKVLSAGGGTAANLTFSTLMSATSAGGSPASVLNKVAAALASAVNKERATSSLLGGNVTFLQSRMDFTANYVNTMTQGSGKLTLADLNTEGANLVALQTRQQIGIQSLSIAGQQQQAVLSLLR